VHGLADNIKCSIAKYLNLVSCLSHHKNTPVAFLGAGIIKIMARVKN